MTWFYKAGDQEFGPISKSQLQELIKSKKISGKTLIRSAPSAPWRPLAEMVRSGAQSNAAAKPSAPSAPSAPPAAPSKAERQTPKPTPFAPPVTAAPPTPSAVCSQCGRSFPQDQVLTFGDQIICAACKPMFVQKLKEGVATTGTFQYGGFWIRFGAKLIDGFILAATRWMLLIPVGFMLFSSMPSQIEYSERIGSPEFMTFIGIRYLLNVIIPAIYNTFFVGRYDATLGKMVCGLKVVTPEGGKVSYMRALGRNFAELVSVITIMIGYIIAAFDPEKRTLHDRIASTRVVYKK